MKNAKDYNNVTNVGCIFIMVNIISNNVIIIMAEKVDTRELADCMDTTRDR
jgi:hypothetical protein